MTLASRNDSPIRQYHPQLGKLIKMSEWSDYTSRGISPWSWLRVIGIDDSTVTVRHATHPTDPAQDTEQYTLPLYVIDPPIGWEPRYTIYCKPSETDKVLSWFARGIAKRQSHDLGNAGAMIWQPMDNCDAAHWQFPEVSDMIRPEDCPRLIRVIKVETEDMGSDSLSAMGRSKRAKLFKQWESEGWSVRYVPYEGGYWERQRETIVHDWQ